MAAGASALAAQRLRRLKAARAPACLTENGAGHLEKRYFTREPTLSDLGAEALGVGGVGGGWGVGGGLGASGALAAAGLVAALSASFSSSTSPVVFFNKI